MPMRMKGIGMIAIRDDSHCSVTQFSITGCVVVTWGGYSRTVAKSTIAEETFQTMLVSKALEALGYDVQPIKFVDYNVAYASIAAGDATFLAVNWNRLHDAQYQY